MQEAENTTSLALLGYIVWSGTFETATQSHSIKGHTHFKLDQKFSTAGSRLRSCPVLQDMDDFRLALAQSFEDDVSCTIVEGGGRDWEDFLAPLHVQLHGHTGPAAPHQFMLVRREHMVEDGATDLVIERGHWGLGIVDHPKDVIMIVKERMHDDALSQPPFLFITNERLEALPKEPAKVRPRNPIPEKEQKEYLKTASAVAQHPWDLHRGAAYLRNWVEHNRELRETH